MTPREPVRDWVEKFTTAKVDDLAGLCVEDAVKEQLVSQKGYFDQLTFLKQQGIPESVFFLQGR